MTVLPAASKVLAPAGTETVPDGPMAAIRLSVTTMSAFSRTSSPFIVTTRAPLSTHEPCGTDRGIVRAIGMVWAFGTRASWTFSFSFSSFSLSVAGASFFASSFFAFSSAFLRCSRAKSRAVWSDNR
jgi:hypothetical protein